MFVNLDKKDRKLLYELDFNSRQPAAKIAKKIGISKQGCTYKINNLIKKNVILSFPTIFNVGFFGLYVYRVYFKLSNITSTKEKEFVDFLVNHKFMSWVAGCEGNWDYVVVIYSESLKHFQNLLNELNNLYGKFIERKDISLITKAHQFRCGYIVGKNPVTTPLVYPEEPRIPIKIDNTDKKILKILANNARTSTISIAKKVDLPIKTVSYRVNRLIKRRIIERFWTLVNIQIIGFEYYKLFLTLKNVTQEKENRFLKYCEFQPNITYYTKQIGNKDVEIELIVKDSIKLHEIISDIRKRFNKIIKNYETLKIYKQYKLNFYPMN
jgi:DNA-binding Lrp family transcriptional regulator